jgi:hypothetical protein
VIVKTVTLHLSLRLDGVTLRPDVADQLPAMLGVLLKRARNRREHVIYIHIHRHEVEVALSVPRELTLSAHESWCEWDYALRGTLPKLPET